MYECGFFYDDISVLILIYGAYLRGAPLLLCLVVAELILQPT